MFTLFNDSSTRHGVDFCENKVCVTFSQIRATGVVEFSFSGRDQENGNTYHAVSFA